MISSIGFLPSGISAERLKTFVADEDIRKSLDYLNIPIVDKSSVFCDDDVDESEEIVENDIVVFCTPNEDDVSFLQFHVQNRECTNMFLHHDTYVFSTVADSAQVTIGGMPYVALGTFEKDIMVFDPLVRNPMIPQALLRGHEDAVLSVEWSNGVLFSGSVDSTVIEWDVERREPRSRVEVAGPVGKICVLGSSVIYSVETTLHCLGKELKFEGDVERIKIRENTMLVSDSVGNLRVYDLRNGCEAVVDKRIHEDSITGFGICGGDVYTGSLDGSIKIVKIETLDVVGSKSTEEKVFSLETHEDGFYVYGGEKNELHLEYVGESFEDNKLQ